MSFVFIVHTLTIIMDMSFEAHGLYLLITLVLHDIIHSLIACVLYNSALSKTRIKAWFVLFIYCVLLSGNIFWIYSGDSKAVKARETEHNGSWLDQVPTYLL
jgi:hypothetical protein